MLGVENWWTGDVNSNPGKELDALISTAGYTQLIDKPTNFQKTTLITENKE